MITLLKHLLNILLFDEAAAQRWLGAVLLAAGNVLGNGGAVPGTSLVIPFGSFAPWAALIGSFVVMPLAIFVAAGGKLPSPEPPPPKE